MIDDLIAYYQRELDYLKRNAGAFAEAYPRYAARLKISRDAIEDPHVSRLIESVAFLNGRLRHKLDEEYSELSDALLLTLYPHLIQPLPSLMVVRLEPEADMAEPVTVPGGTMISTEEIDGVACRYRLCGDTRLLPLRLAEASMIGPPFEAPPVGMGGARGMLRLTFETTRPEVDLAALEIEKLRLFIKSDGRRAQILLEQLGANLLGVAVASGTTDPNAVLLGPDSVRLLGLSEDELLLPQTRTARKSYGLLQEHFAYPHKHLFFEVSGLDRRLINAAGNRFDLFFFFDRVSSELERVVRADDFELHAAPAINLFPVEAEPIYLDHTSVEYRIVPSARQEDAIEVHSVTGVTLQKASGERIETPSLYSFERGSTELGAFFHAIARRSSFSPGGGDDVFLTIADLQAQLLAEDTTVVNTSILATNRDLPARLPFGGGRPHLAVSGTINGLAGVSALSKPTPTRRPARGESAHWKLIGQLSLNYLTLVGNELSGEALREILAIYDTGNTPDSEYLRERLISVSSSPGVARLRFKGHTAMCSGIDVTLEIDDERLSGSGSFLLCAVIERFLAGACALNSFVRVTARLQRETGVWKTWRPRIGDRPLI
ncbi:type VI secretion system protein ImpG [Novosphingobium sp. CF614]|uniref:type VI secretion system baseplate subunit TssF n=1 Tax=Novosphingobium sp. CF614 TaxID=1884364 RepID=UPI0008EB2DA9|nr:type VI secretion system baseplate subunit TssF [Novosphingobium sp. CF614]SFF95174.1 type VI secretion system protein ImpG [Novosphingobium sp. CF614]